MSWLSAPPGKELHYYFEIEKLKPTLKKTDVMGCPHDLHQHDDGSVTTCVRGGGDFVKI